MVKVPPVWHGPSSPPAPPQGALGGSGWFLLPGRSQPTGVQPLPRMLEIAASKVADYIAFDHVGVGGAQRRHLRLPPARLPRVASRPGTAASRRGSGGAQQHGRCGAVRRVTRLPLTCSNGAQDFASVCDVLCVSFDISFSRWLAK
eukprot:scaffold10275_cov45-Phaeocystis_antarctica.AAC.1